MKKRKVLGILFLLVICTSFFALTVLADNGLEKLNSPSEPRWSDEDGWYARFDEVEEAQGVYALTVQGSDEKVVLNYRNSGINPIVGGRLALWSMLNLQQDGIDSGKYRFRVKAVGDGVTTSDSEWSTWSEWRNYEKPDIAFDDVQNLHWSDKEGEAGVVTWDPPANMAKIPEAKRKSLRYFVRLYKDKKSEKPIWGMYNVTDTTMDLRKWMDDDEEGYVFSVQAQSRDIGVCHGREIKSEPYINLENIANQIGGELDDILLQLGEDENGELASPSNALEAVERLDIRETALAVQTNAHALATLKEIEEFYLENSGKEVEKNISEDAGFRADEIDVIGAGLNIASPSNAVALEIKKADMNEVVGLDPNVYSYASAFEIRLKNAVGKLRAPVTIIMPIPDGIDPERLRIVHYHSGDPEPEPIYPIIMGDGRAKFTVTKFSRFVFVERNIPDYGSDDPEEDPGHTGGSGGSGGGGGGGSSSGSSTRGTVTTDSKKGQVNSVTGIITGSGDGYSKWISEAPQQEGAGARWKLQYADGTFAAGSYVTDEQGNLVRDGAGNPIEQPHWEMVNGAWYAFGVDGYIKSGLAFDPALNGWFYLDANTGMKTGWQQIEGKWYYFNQVSDGTKGIMYVNRTTPDGYHVQEDGSWDGQS